VIEEPPGPPKRMFYDEILDPTKRKNLILNLSEAEKIFQQTAYELLTTEKDYVEDLRIMFNVLPFLKLIPFRCYPLIIFFPFPSHNFLAPGVLYSPSK